MSQAEQLHQMYEEIYNKLLTTIKYERDSYPNIEKINTKHINEILESCVKFYNYLDSAKITMEQTLPEIYSELKPIIENNIIGDETLKLHIVEYIKPEHSYRIGSLKRPIEKDIPKGILNIINLLKKSLYYSQTGYSVNRDQCYTTARYSFYNLKGNLIHFLTRFNYVMLYPHRILLDRTILETGLKKHGLEKGLKYVYASEEHYNNQKSIEFCAMARNALEEVVNNISLILEGFDKGFSENLNKLKEIGFVKGTIVKQIKQFRGSLSAGGSHPPTDEMSLNEMKLLQDNLYAYLGFFVINLSKFKVL